MNEETTQYYKCVIFYVPNDVAVINGLQPLNGRFKRSVKMKRVIRYKTMKEV